MTSIKKVGIVVKKKMPEAQKLAEQAAHFLQGCKIQTYFDAKENKASFIQKSDLILVFGGDGTFLSVARQMVQKSVPMLGVNMGALGFLTEVKKTELIQTLQAALVGKLKISYRTMLLCSLFRQNKNILNTPAINDIVISRGAIARIFDMEVKVNGLLVANIKADGIIIATPTGSTAYGLAAGGPVLTPEVPAVSVIPICPHSLTLRPLIITDHSTIAVVPQYRSGKVILTLDGQVSTILKPGDVIRVTKFKKHPLKILHSLERDYYSLLREKLKFGYRD